MKFGKLTSVTTAIFLSTSVNAAMVDNGTYTTDTVTGLDWLALSLTDNQAYSTAPINNIEWRYATNTEVENLFITMFDGYYDTNLTDKYSEGTQGAYADQHGDVLAFIDLFGTTGTSTNTSVISLGFYEDEAGVLRKLGVTHISIETSGYDNTLVYGLDYTYDYDFARDTNVPEAGIFMVRTSVVPVPAALWLFGSGLIGLIGLAKQKKA